MRQGPHQPARAIGQGCGCMGQGLEGRADSVKHQPVSIVRLGLEEVRSGLEGRKEKARPITPVSRVRLG
jgi:hypothetical protein